MRAIKLSGSQSEEMGEHMDDEKRVHVCPSCGEPFPCDSDKGEKDDAHLTEDEKEGMGREKFDRE